MDVGRRSAGDPIPEGCALIQVRVAELKQLFNSMDASPFRDRDLDPQAEEFIVTWAREMPRDAPLALVVLLDRCAGLEDEPAILRTAVHQYFAHRAESARRRLKDLLRIGRKSLVIGLVFLVAALGLGDLIATRIASERIGELVREGLTIGGWVAMWRPLEIFLYGWWPIRAESRLHRRLAAMPVRIEYAEGASNAWRRDWPAVRPTAEVAARSS